MGTLRDLGFGLGWSRLAFVRAVSVFGESKEPESLVAHTDVNWSCRGRAHHVPGGLTRKMGLLFRMLKPKQSEWAQASAT